MIHAVIFDLGRVMVEFDRDAELLRGQLIDGPTIERMVRDESFAAYATGRIGSREYHRLLVEQTGLAADYDRFVELWCGIFQPMPGMERLFLDVAERVSVGILSDTDPLHWAHLRRVMPWLGRVARPTLSFEIGRLKPAPEAFLAAARDVGFPPEECFFVDDLPRNVAGARAVGLDAVLFAGADDLRLQLRERGVLA